MVSEMKRKMMNDNNDSFLTIGDYLKQINGAKKKKKEVFKFDYTIYEDKATGDKFAVIEKNSDYFKVHRDVFGAWTVSQTCFIKLDEYYESEKNYYHNKSNLSSLFLNPSAAFRFHQYVEIDKNFDQLFLQALLMKDRLTFNRYYVPAPKQDSLIYDSDFTAYPPLDFDRDKYRAFGKNFGNDLVKHMKKQGTFVHLLQHTLMINSLDDSRKKLTKTIESFENSQNELEKNIAVDAKAKKTEIMKKLHEIVGALESYANDYCDFLVNEKRSESLNTIVEADEVLKKSKKVS